VGSGTDMTLGWRRDSVQLETDDRFGVVWSTETQQLAWGYRFIIHHRVGREVLVRVGGY
jgi:hypothetical protein